MIILKVAQLPPTRELPRDSALCEWLLGQQIHERKQRKTKRFGFRERHIRGKSLIISLSARFSSKVIGRESTSTGAGGVSLSTEDVRDAGSDRLFTSNSMRQLGSSHGDTEKVPNLH
jgi:hypothetical protein